MPFALALNFFDQGLGSEILQVKNLRDRASEKGQTKEYPLLLDMILTFKLFFFSLYPYILYYAASLTYVINIQLTINLSIALSISWHYSLFRIISLTRSVNAKSL